MAWWRIGRRSTRTVRVRLAANVLTLISAGGKRNRGPNETVLVIYTTVTQQSDGRRDDATERAQKTENDGTSLRGDGGDAHRWPKGGATTAEEDGAAQRGGI